MSAAQGVRSTRSETHFVGQPLLPLDRDHLRIRLGEIVSRTVQQIAADFLQRKEGCKRDITLLESGFWYPNAYFAALKECKKEKRLEYFVKNGSFYHGSPNTKNTGLKSVPDQHVPRLSPTEKLPGAFFLASKTIPASRALQALQQNLILGDCAQLCQVGQYQALLEVLGEERFNKLFSSDLENSMVISNYLLIGNPLLVFLTPPYGGGEKGSRPVNIGQRVGFMNYKHYALKHLNGDAGSYNAICVDATPGAQKYVSLGTPAEGLTEDQMLHFMTEEYNHEPVDFATFTAEIAKKIIDKLNVQIVMEANRLKHCKITPAENAANQAGFTSHILGFNLDIVELALKTPLEQLSIGFLKEHRKMLENS